jgi:uroporphyrinogen decarboxylase
MHVLSGNSKKSSEPIAREKTDRALLSVLRGERRDPPPIWLMRQAGRYLPEYRELRAAKGGFLDLCYDPQAAAEITLQPIRRFGFDGAILFSDILVIPHAMGQQLWFETGEGPRLAPPLLDGDFGGLVPDKAKLDPVYETVRRVVSALPAGATMLGFAGSPWTVATYMVAGQGTKDQNPARRLAYRDPAAFRRLIDAIATATVDYLIGQIDAGVEAVQLFDSWAGSLAPDEFLHWVVAPNRAIVEQLRARRPGTPIIGFPKGIGEKLPVYARETGVDALGIDETIDPAWVQENLPKGLPVQGNLDPLALLAGGIGLENAVNRIRGAFSKRPHIFNLGHGILPDTPVVHVEELLSMVRA